MDYQPKYISEETKRGGCLDSAMTFVSLGLLGVETTVHLPEDITPTDFLTDADGNTYVNMVPSSMTRKVLESGQPIIVNSFEEANAPKVTRKIIRTR